jgi:hypothetical protein
MLGKVINVRLHALHIYAVLRVRVCYVVAAFLTAKVVRFTFLAHQLDVVRAAPVAAGRRRGRVGHLVCVGGPHNKSNLIART